METREARPRDSNKGNERLSPGMVTGNAAAHHSGLRLYRPKKCPLKKFTEAAGPIFTVTEPRKAATQPSAGARRNWPRLHETFSSCPPKHPHTQAAPPYSFLVVLTTQGLITLVPRDTAAQQERAIVQSASRVAAAAAAGRCLQVVRDERVQRPAHPALAAIQKGFLKLPRSNQFSCLRILLRQAMLLAGRALPLAMHASLSVGVVHPRAGPGC